jgi:hypothetical protein
MSNSETQYFHARRSDALRRRTSSCTHVNSAAALQARGATSSVVALRTGNPERTRTHARQAETFVVV